MKRNLLFNQLTAIGKRFAMVLTMLLIVGIGQVWGETVTLTTNSSTVGKGTPVTEKFDYKLTFTSTTDAGNAYVQNAKSSSIYNTVAIPGTITSIKLTDCATTSSKTDGLFTVYGGTSSDSGCTNKMAEITGLSSTKTDKTITFSGNYTFFKITVGSARVLKISSIVITYTPSSSGCTQPATALSIINSNTATIGTPLALTTSGGNGSLISWSVTNGTGSATISNSTLIPTAAGIVTVTATQDDNNGKCGATVEQQITISAASNPEPDGDCNKWVEVDLSDIQSTDSVVIAMTNGTITWALTNGNGTYDAPVATILTMNTDGSISENPKQISDAILWNISNNETLTISPKESSTTWLYCTNNNDGVRVGTNANQTFTVVKGIGTDAENYFLQHTATNRYVGVYTTNPDWRCYTLTNQGAFPTNLRGQTLKFYKYVACGSTETTHYLLRK